MIIFKLLLLAGKNEKMKNRFCEVVDRNQKSDTVKILEFTDKVPELMHIADLVVTKPGGLTTSESLASNLPMVIINPIPGQEEENAAFLEENGTCVWLKKDDNPKLVFQDLFSDEDKLISMRINTNRLAKKYSTRDICDIIINDCL